MATKIEKDNNETKKKIKVEKREEFRSYYLQQRKVILSILTSLYIVTNVNALMLTTFFDFASLFLYFGIIMLVIIFGIIVTIVYEGNYFWAFLVSIIIGVIPTIKLVIGLAIGMLDITSLILAIFSLILSVLLIFLPSIIIYFKSVMSNINKKNEQE